jgi:hypothetical protein
MQASLKRWSTPQNKIWTYRTLVSHAQVGLWRERSTKGVAFQEHLYTQIVDGRESADIEEWLDKEFEAPAEEALDKATSDERLTPDDWRILVGFLAAQDVRTPTRLSEALQRWESELPERGSVNRCVKASGGGLLGGDFHSIRVQGSRKDIPEQFG